MELLTCPIAPHAINDTSASAWKTRYQAIYCVWFWFTTLDVVLLFLGSLIIFFLVVFKRKIRDPFLIVQLTCNILSNALFITYSVMLLKKIDNLVQITECLARVFYLLGHWAFASKYLRTSYVLPNLLIQTDLDFIHRRTS